MPTYFDRSATVVQKSTSFYDTIIWSLNGTQKKLPAMKSNSNLGQDDDLRPEYDLSQLEGGTRGKYLERYRAGTNLALLAPEVRAAFPTDDAVNQALRSIMQSQHS
jgi:hypothetical protein